MAGRVSHKGAPLTCLTCMSRSGGIQNTLIHYSYYTSSAADLRVAQAQGGAL